MKKIDSYFELNKKELFRAIMAFAFNGLALIATVFAVLAINAQSFSGALDLVKHNYKRAIFVVFSIVTLVIVSFMFFYHQNKKMMKRARNITMIFLILIVSIIVCYLFGKINVFLRPVALCAALILILLDKPTAVFMSSLFSVVLLIADVFCVNFIWNDYVIVSLIISFTSGIASVFLIDGEGSRAKVFLMGFLVSVPVIICALCVNFSINVNVLYALGSGVLSVSLMIILLPIFELLFGALTNFRLAELTDHKSRLIKELSKNAPGTFSHTIIVAMLAEACGNAIGENPLLVRACAYYHDMGKLKNPEYFTENQTGKNPHDDLSPELSTDIIRSHAKEGAELIRRRHLPEVLASAAEQHHGTLPIRYFYMKASKFTDGKLNIENFSYYGPKPQTKVNAIIMICDACEAKSRTLANRNHENVDKAVKEIIEERMNLDQFNECDITFKELDVIRNTITNTLSGVYHERVKYPKLKTGGRRGG